MRSDRAGAEGMETNPGLVSAAEGSLQATPSPRGDTVAAGQALLPTSWPQPAPGTQRQWGARHFPPPLRLPRTRLKQGNGSSAWCAACAFITHAGAPGKTLRPQLGARPLKTRRAEDLVTLSPTRRKMYWHPRHLLSHESIPDCGRGGGGAGWWL